MWKDYRRYLACLMTVGMLLTGHVWAAEAPPEESTPSVQEELASIREELAQLRETLDLLVNKMMADLEAENAQLRSELSRMVERETALGVADAPGIPRPGGALVEQVLAEPQPEPAPEPASDNEGAFGYQIVEEWGRSPEIATQLGGNASSLKGMVLVVPPNSARDDIETLGRDLHLEYAAYDNLNIEVFDNEDAARAYAERHVTNPAHRVLSISRHQQTGRDVILYLQGGTTEELAF